MTAILAPRRTDQQRLAALERANKIRILRAELKREIRSRERNAVEIILDPPWYAENMKARDVLLAIPIHGPVKVGKLMRIVGVSPAKTVGGLSVRQRDALARELRR